MTKIFKSTLLLLSAVFLFASCSDDNDSNPILRSPKTFVLNTPALAENGVYDLANSSTIELTCTQPDYGFPAVTRYTVQVGTEEKMSDAQDMSTTFTSAKMDVDAAELAAQLTSTFLAKGKTETDFPMDIPVYIRLKAQQITAAGDTIANTAITSNVVKLNKVHLLFSLPPVTTPENLYITGAFNGWSWDSALSMTQVNGASNVFWHMVYIDGKGIKFNSEKAWDGNEAGFAKITVNPSSELGSEIIDGDGNIASSKPGWYLMVVECGVDGRNITYNVTFNKPNVYLMGLVTAAGDWKELEEAALFTAPTTADGQFVSPAFSTSVPGGATSDDQGVRAYVKVPGFDWWKSEFIIYDGKIAYRANGGDQTPRVAGNAGQKLHLNFNKETGEIK